MSKLNFLIYLFIFTYQGAPGPTGPPGPAGTNGDKVKNMLCCMVEHKNIFAVF